MKGWKEKGGSTFGSLARIIQGKKDSSFTNLPSEFATFCNTLELHIVEFHSPKAETFFSCMGPVYSPPLFALGNRSASSFSAPPLPPDLLSAFVPVRLGKGPSGMSTAAAADTDKRERDCSRVGRGVTPPSLFTFFRGSCCNLLPSFYSSFFPKLHVVQDP